MVSPREMWLEKRVEYLESCFRAIGIRTDPKSIYAYRQKQALNVEELPNSYRVNANSIIEIPSAVRLDVDQAKPFGWEITVTSALRGKEDGFGMAIYAWPPPGESQAAEYIQSLLEQGLLKMYKQLWGDHKK